MEPDETRTAQALEIIERALALACTADVPAEEKFGWVNSFADMLAAVDPDRGFALVEAGASEEEHSEALERVAARAMVAFPARAAEFVRLAGGGGWRTAVALGTVAKADPCNALKAARAFGDMQWRVEALCEVAAAMARADSPRSAEIAREALDTAQSATTDESHGRMMAAVVRALRLVDREAALTIAREMDDASALLDVAAAFVRYGDDRARAVLEMAETAAEGPYPMHPDWSRVAIAEAWAHVDPKRAVELARAVAEDSVRVWALSRMLPYLETVDPDDARTLAEDLLALGGQLRVPCYHDYQWWRSVLLVMARLAPEATLELAARADDKSRYCLVVNAAGELAAQDLERTMALANELRQTAEHGAAMVGIVGHVARSDPDRALELARQIKDWRDRGCAYINVIRELISANPERALQIAERLRKDVGAGSFQDLLIEIADAMGQTCPETAKQVLLRVLRDRKSYTRNPEIAKMHLSRILHTLTRVDPDTGIGEALKLNDANLALGMMLEATANLLCLESFDEEETDEFAPWAPLP